MNARDFLRQVRAQLNEKSPVQWADYQLLRWGSESGLDLAQRMPTAFPHLLRTFSGTTTSGTSDYVFPKDFLAFYAAELNSVPCKTVSRDDSWSLTRGAFPPSAFYPCVEPISASVSSYPARSSARFYPTPGTTTPPYKFWYWKRPAELSQQVATFEPNENWTGTGVTRAASSGIYTATETNEEEGALSPIDLTDIGKAVQLQSAAAETITAAYTLPEAADYGLDRTDEAEIWLRTTGTNVTDVRLQFHTTAGSAYYSVTVAPSSFAANGARLRIPKSRFTATGSPSWDNITELRLLLTPSAGATVTFDDWRIRRSSELPEQFHPLLCDWATAKALANDAGWLAANDPANLFTLLAARADNMLGKAA